MDKKKIQTQRKKGYFIEATKRIVKEEGVSELTVKKVADLAGYAPGTLYNYFSDLNELLFYSIVDFFEECKEYALKRAEGSKTAKEKTINLAKGYSSYFIENPKIYQLAFLEDIKIPQETVNEEEYIPEIVRLSAENLKICAQEGFIAKEDIEIILGLMANIIHGNLLFFIKARGSRMAKEEVIEKIIREIEYVLAK